MRNGRAEFSDGGGSEPRLETTACMHALSLRSSGGVGDGGCTVVLLVSCILACERVLSRAGGWDWCSAGDWDARGRERCGVGAAVGAGGGVGVTSLMSMTRYPERVFSRFDELEPPNRRVVNLAWNKLRCLLKIDFNFKDWYVRE